MEIKNKLNDINSKMNQIIKLVDELKLVNNRSEQKIENIQEQINEIRSEIKTTVINTDIIKQDSQHLQKMHSNIQQLIAFYLKEDGNEPSQMESMIDDVVKHNLRRLEINVNCSIPSNYKT